MTATTYEPAPMPEPYRLPMGMDYTPQREQRQRALDAAGATGRRYEFVCYDVVAGPARAWIAEDHWVPEDDDGYDPIREEWPRVAWLLDSLGYPISGWPYLDEIEDIWIWEVPRG